MADVMENMDTPKVTDATTWTHFNDISVLSGKLLALLAYHDAALSFSVSYLILC